MRLVKISLTLFMVVCAASSFAADTLSANFPTALLIQIRSEHNRIVEMEKENKPADLAIVKDDAVKARNAMMYDFATKFNYCPVYYFVDTNAELVKKKAFAGILMNADGSAVSSTVINNLGNEYAIVYYGYPISQSQRHVTIKDTIKYRYDYDSRPVKGLVILDDKYLQVSYVYKLEYYELVLGHKKTRKDFYSSKRFDIGYYPLAKLLNTRLGQIKNNSRIKH